MYREPRRSVMDKHTLIELDGDFTDQEMGHLLRKAYENHKAPHEYDDIKKYIRDMVIGEHNSLYIMHDGNPTPFGVGTTLAIPSLMYGTGQQGSGYLYDSINSCLLYAATSDWCTFPSPGGMGFQPISYNNGIAIGWAPLYTTSQPSTWPTCQGQFGCSTIPTNDLLVAPNGLNASQVCGSFQTIISPKYSYAAYQSSTNPLTLSTYHYWTLPTTASTQSYNYVYFTYIRNANQITFVFYSSGTFILNPGVSYITMWQWTYT